MQERILILGAKGNLGGELVSVYHGNEVLAWDLPDLDITDEPRVLARIAQLRPDIVFNCAAYTNVDGAEDNRVLAEAINGRAVGSIARACSKIEARLVHYSTGQVFPGTNPRGYDEGDQPSPINAYGASKLLGEQELQKISNRFYLIRTCWLYGNPTIGKKSFPDLMLEMARKNQSISVVTDEVGSPTYVKDLAQASRALVEEQKPFGIYHLTNSGQANRYTWAKAVFDAMKLDAALEPVDASFFQRKAKRPKFELLNNHKYLQLRPWTEALHDYLSPS